jgi:hypothetical protein
MFWAVKPRRSLINLSKYAFCQKSDISNTYKIQEIKIEDKLNRPVVLKSLPWNRIHPKFDTPPKLFNSKGKEVTVEEMVKDDIRNYLPNMVLSQIDPMVYAFEMREMSKKFSVAVLTPEEQKSKEVIKQIKHFENTAYSMLHPNNGKDTVLDISGPEIIYNLKYGVSKSSEWAEFFNKFMPIVNLIHADDLSEQEEEEFKEGYAKIKKYLDFVWTRYLSSLNPSPFFNMEAVFQTAVYKLVDFSFSGYPEQLHRIILDRIKKMSLGIAKEIFEKVYNEGKKLQQETGK